MAVGSGAALLHWGVVVALVELAACTPLLANPVGWLVALVGSYLGHHRLSFRGHGAPLLRSVMRFMTVSATGFLINTLSYALLLRFSAARYEVLLGLVLVGVAFATWWLSRHWVFLRSEEPP